MAVRIQSFIVGLAIAGAVLGLAFIVYNAFAGDDEPDFTAGLPTSAPTAVAGDPAQPSQTPGGPALTTPTISPALVATAVPAPASGSLADRTSCAAIQGTAYRSDAERDWYNANCGATPESSSSSPEPEPTATPPPVHPDVTAFLRLTSEYDAAVAGLGAVAAAPQLQDEAWRLAATAAAQHVQSMGTVAINYTTPACLGEAKATLSHAIPQLQLVSNLLITSISQPQIAILSIIGERAAAARASITEAAQIANAATC